MTTDERTKQPQVSLRPVTTDDDQFLLDVYTSTRADE
jgi:hypothetical protein